MKHQCLGRQARGLAGPVPAGQEPSRGALHRHHRTSPRDFSQARPMALYLCGVRYL